MKTRLLATTLLFGVSGGMWASAIAQDTSSDDPVVISEEADDEEATLDRVLVTGSRIKRPDIDTVFPTTFVDTETLEKNAFNNIADALNQIPAFGGAPSPAGGQGGNIAANFVDFLDLGPQRTLTLVNGRRFVSGDVTGDLSVDFNVIPLALVERIDTVGVGGAPIYGSDAIAGTVNVILKDDFEGFEATAQYGVSEFGDADTFRTQFVAGANTPDGRGNVTISAEFFNQQGVSQLDRPEVFIGDPFNSNVPAGTPGFPDVDVDGDGVPDAVTRAFGVGADGPEGNVNLQLFTLGGVISGTPGGGFLPSFGIGGFGGEFFQFADNGDLVPFEVGTDFPGSGGIRAIGGTDFDFFNLAGQVQSPLERINIASTVRYELADWVQFKADIQVANTTSTELANQGGFQTGFFTGLSGAIELEADNPFLNAQATDVLAGLGIGPDDTIFVNRFNNDLIDNGARDSESFLWRISAGLDGDFNFADREFSWEIYGTAGETTNETLSAPLLNNTRFLNAVEAVALTQADIDGILAAGNNPLGEVGDIVCQVTRDFALLTAAEQIDPLLGGQIRGVVAGSGLVNDDPQDVTACEPLNLFGANNNTPEALDFISQRGPTSNDIDQSVFSANITGQAVKLPAGWLSFAAGYETRRERASFDPGGAVEVGLGRGPGVPLTGGSFTTQEFSGELYVPIVSPDLNIPLVHNLEAEGSIRQIDNSLAGDATVWTVGGSYSPVPDLTVRGNRTRSVRAPNLFELFQPQVTAFSFADDPCDEEFIVQSEFADNRAINCAAAGITQPFVSNVVSATAMGLSGGNPNLSNETANAFSVGLLAQPRWVPGLTVQVDYIDVAIDDAISAVTLEANLESCFNSDPADFASNPSCSAFTRDADFQIVDFLSGQINADNFDTRFLLLAADYRFDVADALNLAGRGVKGDWGTFALNMNVSHVLQRDVQVNGVLQANTIGEPFDPRWSGTNDFTYSKDGLRLFWRVLWTDRILFDASGDSFFALGDEVINSVSGRVLHNASVSYDLSEALSNYDNPLILQLNVNNVLGREAGTGLQRSFGNTGLPEQLGRTFTVRLRAVF